MAAHGVYHDMVRRQMEAQREQEQGELVLSTV
jgi:hypothetical protein